MLDSCVESPKPDWVSLLGTRHPEAMPTTVVTLRRLLRLRCWMAPMSFRPAQKYGATNPGFGSVARGTAHQDSDIDILVEMDPADGNLLMRASGLMEEARQLFDEKERRTSRATAQKAGLDAAIADAVEL